MGDGNDEFVLGSKQSQPSANSGRIVGSDESRRKRRDLTAVQEEDGEEEKSKEQEAVAVVEKDVKAETAEIPQAELVERAVGDKQYTDAEGVRDMILCIMYLCRNFHRKQQSDTSRHGLTIWEIQGSRTGRRAISVVKGRRRNFDIRRRSRRGCPRDDIREGKRRLQSRIRLRTPCQRPGRRRCRCRTGRGDTQLEVRRGGCRPDRLYWD